MINPSLSVVLPLYNGAQYVSEAIESIVTQADLPREWEIIVIDDGSTDDGVAICQRLAQRYKQIRIEVQPSNQGVTVARNRGIKLARFEYLCFIDQDDIWVSDKWRKQLKALTEIKPDYVLGHQAFFMQDDQMPLPSWFRQEWALSSQQGYLFGCLLIRRHDFLKFGLLDERCKYGADDVEWFGRARQISLNVLMLSEIVLKRRIHMSNASAQTQHSTPALLALIRRRLASGVGSRT